MFEHCRRLALGAALAFACLAAGCCEREPTVPTTDPLYGRFEAPEADNACQENMNCVASGCSGEVCAAEPLVTTCELLPRTPEGTCTCFNGLCTWTRNVCW